MKTKRIIAALLAAVMIVIALCSCTEQNHDLTEKDKDTLKDKIEQHLSDNGLSAAVYAVYKGEDIYSGGHGNAAENTPNSPDAAYGIASLTKQFTAAAVLQLSEAGKLDINDKLSKYFPDYSHGEEIVIKQLLCQRSGIPDYEVNTYNNRIIITCEDESGGYTELKAENTAEQNIAIIQSFFMSRELIFKPGAQFDYSDSNYSLLASVIEKASGEGYHEYIRKHIFEPLKMNAAFIDDHEGFDAVLADSDRSGFSVDYYLVKGAEFGCGDILATPNALYIWYKGLFGGKVISQNSLSLMTENYYDQGYGFGLMIRDTDSPMYYHTGYIPSYYNTAIYFPEEDYFQVVLANRGYGDPHSTAYEMARDFCSLAQIDF